MAKGVLGGGERVAGFFRPLGSQEALAVKIGMRRSGVFRLTRPGVWGMHVDNFVALATQTNHTFDQLKAKIGAGPDAERRRTRRVLIDLNSKDYVALGTYAKGA